MSIKKKILVIEDDKDISRTIKLYLEGEGFEVITVSDGKEGLQKAKAAGEDILILDLMLPGMPGEEICRELRKEEKYAALPIIMLTAKGTDAEWVRGMVLGANYYITKPFEMDDLLSTIQLLLKH
ncbi:MAG: response regulator [Candidatus Omnitrophica bacterium]|nr:response regulator [Candidatus Omnitrophota bacterium]